MACHLSFLLVYAAIHVHAVHPHVRHLAPKVRALVDFLVQRFSGVPDWHQGWT